MAIGKAPGVTLLSPPYFLHQDSPVMDQLRSVKANLKSEFEEFCKHHDMTVCAHGAFVITCNRLLDKCAGVRACYKLCTHLP